MKNNLTVHCVVKDEENWIWYAINSILDIADKVLVYDTGSTDKTVEIINSIKSSKISFKETGVVTAKGLVDLRSQQLKVTKTGWFLILDGDEIWLEKTKKELVSKIKNSKKEDWGIVVRAWNLVGDIYHYHPESINYNWPFAPKNYLGWANLRVLKTDIPGLYIDGAYPQEAYRDIDNRPIQNYGKKHLIFLQNRYLHASYLLRSESRNKDKKVLNRLKKWKIESGIKFDKNFKFPDVLYKKRPSIVNSPWVKRGVAEATLAKSISPIKEIRRKVLNLYNPK